MSTGLYAASNRDHLDRLMYCGRYAVVAATGATSSQVTTAINICRGKNNLDAHIGATGVSELNEALKLLGYKTHSERVHWRDKTPTFTQWRKLEQHSRTVTYIVLITGHWVTVRGDWMTDTCNNEPIDLSRKNPYARKRVQAVIKIKRSI